MRGNTTGSIDDRAGGYELADEVTLSRYFRWGSNQRQREKVSALNLRSFLTIGRTV